ncbi:hypothetical protein ACQKWADRAFT_299025 [Trichoderma austrokoningii]
MTRVGKRLYQQQVFTEKKKIYTPFSKVLVRSSNWWLSASHQSGHRDSGTQRIRSQS